MDWIGGIGSTQSPLRVNVLHFQHNISKHPADGLCPLVVPGESAFLYTVFFRGGGTFTCQLRDCRAPYDFVPAPFYCRWATCQLQSSSEGNNRKFTSLLTLVLKFLGKMILQMIYITFHTQNEYWFASYKWCAVSLGGTAEMYVTVCFHATRIISVNGSIGIHVSTVSGRRKQR